MIAMPGREDRIKIIYDEWEERDYENPSRYATIDRRIYSGESDRVKGSSRLGHDRYVLGKGYLGSALMILFPLVRDENYHEAGDILILPVMNVIREGLEHWFKSSLISLASIYKTEYPAGDDRIYDPDPNEIYGLYDDLKEALKDKEIHSEIDYTLTHLDSMIGELKKADEDSGSYIYVDLIALFESLVKVFEGLGDFISYLLILEEENKALTDEGYEEYLGRIADKISLMDMKGEDDFWDFYTKR